MRDLKIQAIVDNHRRPETELLATEAGLSYWIDYGEKSFLFDTGDGEAIQRNLPALKRDLESIDSIILSHGHYDHTGGLAWVLRGNQRAEIYAKTTVAKPLWSERVTGFATAGMSQEAASLAVDRFHYFESVIEIAPDFFLIPKASECYPRPASSKFLWEGNEGNLQPDSFDHECFIVVKRANGLIVITGCSHQGVSNMVDQAKRLFPDQPVLHVIGGFHLQGRKPDFHERQETIDAVGEYLQENTVQTVYTGHCTGLPAFARLQEKLGDQVQYFYAGDILEL